MTRQARKRVVAFEAVHVAMHARDACACMPMHPCPMHCWYAARNMHMLHACRWYSVRSRKLQKSCACGQMPQCDRVAGTATLAKCIM
eukprot:366558-Chlamydomonas_euryale.AAC.18